MDEPNFLLNIQINRGKIGLSHTSKIPFKQKNHFCSQFFRLKSKSGKVKAKVRFKIIIPSNPNYNPLTDRRKSESNISLGAKLAKNIKDGVRNSFNLETVLESEQHDEQGSEPYSQPKSNQSSPLALPRNNDTRRHTIADLDQNVSLTDLPMVKRRDSIRRKKNPLAKVSKPPSVTVSDFSEGTELEKLTKENQMLIKMNSMQQETIKQKVSKSLLKIFI